jgi:uridine kinase
MKGGPSGSGKTSLAYKMANIVGCEVISLENYYKSEQVREFKYDDFTSLDLPLLLKVCVLFIQVLYIYVHPHLPIIEGSYM